MYRCVDYYSPKIRCNLKYVIQLSTDGSIPRPKRPDSHKSFDPFNSYGLRGVCGSSVSSQKKLLTIDDHDEFVLRSCPDGMVPGPIWSRIY